MEILFKLKWIPKAWILENLCESAQILIQHQILAAYAYICGPAQFWQNMFTFFVPLQIFAENAYIFIPSKFLAKIPHIFLTQNFFLFFSQILPPKNSAWNPRKFHASFTFSPNSVMCLVGVLQEYQG